ncbi:hypothetical protein GSI_05058 [Ganoderma sinense ZZ0214-1]|uniref:Uncharacterized protein n=1 Tax=Ganoderma sinense ZZ0214-1 TaxID=1077348 RepID=A0A2G8SGN6_9APHY|nr:hypothetical protein GSI_05058 [Ganoderma sinense ZZ0214-1]
MAPPADPRLIIWRSEYKEMKKSDYCPIVRQLCHVDATNRIPPAPAKCPSCDLALGTFYAFLTYKAEQAGMWLFKVGPSPVIAEAIRKQLEENAIAAFEAQAQKEEEKALKMAIIQSKRESQQREKALVQQQKALASIERVRSEAFREHEKDVRKGSGIAGSAKPLVSSTTPTVHSKARSAVQLIKVLMWYQPDEDCVALDLQVNASEAFYLSDHEIFSDIWNGDEVHGMAWCIELNAWTPGSDPITIDEKTRMVLVRRDFTGHCLGFGTELRVLHAIRSSEGQRKALATERAKKKKILSQAIEPGYVRIVFWHDNDQPAIEDIVLKIKDIPIDEAQTPSESCILRLSNQIFELLRSRHEPAVDVFDDSVSDWERFPIRANIPIYGRSHTLLIRIPRVVGMPHLGVEIEALRTPRTTSSRKSGGSCSDNSSSTAQSRKRPYVSDAAGALAYLDEFDTRSRSSSVESWHPGAEAMSQCNNLHDGFSGTPAPTSKSEVGEEASGGEGRIVLGERNAKKVKLVPGDVKLNWQEAEKLENGQTVFDLDMLYGDA